MKFSSKRVKPNDLRKYLQRFGCATCLRASASRRRRWIGNFIHFQCALYSPQIYAKFGRAPLYPLMGRIWTGFVMPHITAFALCLVAFELAVGVLLLSKGRAVTLALTASVLFNLFLVQLGLTYPATPCSLRDFALNRLPNVLFILAQLPLFWVRFDRSLPDLLRSRFRI